MVSDCGRKHHVLVLNIVTIVFGTTLIALLVGPVPGYCDKNAMSVALPASTLAERPYRLGLVMSVLWGLPGLITALTGLTDVSVLILTGLMSQFRYIYTSR